MADALLPNFARFRFIQASLRKTFVGFALGSKATPAVSGTDDRSQPKANIGWPSSRSSATYAFLSFKCRAVVRD